MIWGLWKVLFFIFFFYSDRIRKEIILARNFKVQLFLQNIWKVWALNCWRYDICTLTCKLYALRL